MPNNLSSANAHKLLNILISKAILSGQVGKGHILIPLIDLYAEQDGNGLEKHTADAHGILLRVEIKVDWEADESISIDDEFEIDMKDVDEEQDDEQ